MASNNPSFDNDVSAQKPPKKKKRVRVFSLCLLAVLIFLITGFGAHFIPSDSMEPTLKLGDHTITMKKWLAYPMGRVPARGDIIIFQLPKDIGDSSIPEEESVGSASVAENLKERFLSPHRKGELLIKRVIGLPGEKVQTRGGKVAINGKPLNESGYKILLGNPDFDSVYQYAIDTPLTVPAGEVFVMGDNRANSDDGRVWGTLKLSDIIGKHVRVLYNEGGEGKNTQRAEDEKNKSNR